MQARAFILWLLAGMAAVGLGWWWLATPVAETRTAPVRPASKPELTVHGPRFPPTEAAEPSRPARDLNREIAELGARRPAYEEPIRRRFALSSDLYRFVMDLLLEGQGANGAGQYHIYLALDQCRPYLRIDPQGAQQLYETAMLQLGERPLEERMQWQSEYLRCRNFAGGDLGLVREALGADLPGAEIEYGSVFFERAAESGYPPALLEEVLRVTEVSEAQRIDRLQEALGSGDPEVYWLLFNHLRDADDAQASVSSLSWLIVACRGGYDCTAQADWFRYTICGQEQAACRSTDSAIGYYWYALSPSQRELAFTRAEAIENGIQHGNIDPSLLPALPTRDFGESPLRD